MTDPNNPLNITDEDIGKEGRFLFDGGPAVLVAIARDKNGVAYGVAFKWLCEDGSELIGLSNITYSGIARVPRKRYIGVAPKPDSRGRYGTTQSYQTRKEAEDEVCEYWTIIEIPDPEDVVK